ncbi:MAG: DUF302 domain-containing protein [Nitratireductor sp.]
MRPIFPKAMVAGICLWAALPASSLADEQIITEYLVEDSFENVHQDLSDAIVNRGYHIEHAGDVGSMLKRTGDTVGASKTVYENAGFLQFCSAVLSRGAMEADPANIAFCPYVVFAYETPDDGGKVHVGFRRLTPRGSEQSLKAIADVNALLDEIVREAAGQ